MRNALTKQYEALFGYSGVEIRFTTRALKRVAGRALERGMGARGLRGVLEGVLLEAMYDVPGSVSIRFLVQGKAAGILSGTFPIMQCDRVCDMCLSTQK